MSEQNVNWENLRCLYAEDLKGKRITLKIGGVRDTPKGARMFSQAGESEAWDVAFDMKDSNGKTPYIQIPKANKFGKASGLLRTYRAAAGGDPSEDQIGKPVVLFPVPSKKSQTGEAIRVATDG
jgi:hypothetical protein